MKIISNSSVIIYPETVKNTQGVACRNVGYQGQVTIEPVEGVVLEAAVQTKQGLLLFMTSDVIYEDALFIHYFNQELQPLDSLTMDWITGSGVFRDLVIQSEDRLSFQFLGDKAWELTLFSSQKPCVPYVSEPAGVSRKLSFRRHMMLQRCAQAQTV